MMMCVDRFNFQVTVNTRPRLVMIAKDARDSSVERGRNRFLDVLSQALFYPDLSYLTTVNFYKIRIR